MNTPNLLTILRIILIPVFIIFLINGHFGSALLIFILAGVTDGLDGLIARVYKQKTVLGSYLVPVADKLLIGSSFMVLTFLKIVPSWLTVTVVSRDILIIIGIMVFFFTSHKVVAKPSIASKITTCLQLLTIFSVLLNNYSHMIDDNILSVIIWAAGISTIVSEAHYIYRGSKILSEEEDKEDPVKVINPKAIYGGLPQL